LRGNLYQNGYIKSREGTGRIQWNATYELDWTGSGSCPITGVKVHSSRQLLQ
jgi:hypothetical protein